MLNTMTMMMMIEMKIMIINFVVVSSEYNLTLRFRWKIQYGWDEMLIVDDNLRYYLEIGVQLW